LAGASVEDAEGFGVKRSEGFCAGVCARNVAFDSVPAISSAAAIWNRRGIDSAILGRIYLALWLDAEDLNKVARDPEISAETKDLAEQTRAAQLHPSNRAYRFSCIRNSTYYEPAVALLADWNFRTA
jgi:hypothetical protein